MGRFFGKLLRLELVGFSWIFLDPVGRGWQWKTMNDKMISDKSQGMVGREFDFVCGGV
jgi:hypothetical protein